MLPGAAVRAGEEPVGFVVVDDAAGGGIPAESAAQLEGEIGEDTTGGGDVALLDVGDGAGTVADAGEEVAHVSAHRGGGKGLDVLFGAVLGIFVVFDDRVLVHAAAAIGGEEIVGIDAGFKDAFVAVEGGGPGVFGIGRVAPGAMVPDNLEVAIVENGGLGVGDVGFAGFINKDAAGGIHGLGPAEVEEPAGHVKHVDAHVADDAVAVLHEGAPTAGVDPLVVGAHRSGAGPEIVVEVFRRVGVRRIAGGPHVVVAT